MIFGMICIILGVTGFSICLTVEIIVMIKMYKGEYDMNKGLYLIERQQLEIINGFPTGNICIGVTKEELAELEQELKDYQEIKTYMQQYGIENIEELRRILHNNWVIRQKFKTDTANVAKALEVIKEKKVNLEYLKCCETYEQYKTVCSYWDEITQEEWNFLREVLL